MKTFFPAPAYLSFSRNQRGITLIVALIFLAILTLLGVTAAQVMGQEERMAGNTRNRDMALQAAEAALVAASTACPAVPPATTIETPGSGGVYNYALCMPNSQAFWNGTGDKDCDGVAKAGFNWDAAGATQAIAGVLGVAEQPKYVIEKMPDLGGACRHRVTARAVGGDANAVVILQAVYTQ